MRRKSKIRTRVTKQEVHNLMDSKKNKKSFKKIIIPGPWTEVSPPCEAKAYLKENESLLGKCLGTYPQSDIALERGWYPIIINVTATNLCKLVDEHGVDNVLAACEKSLNTSGEYGNIVLLKMTANSLHKDTPFFSCLAKTNKKSIIGFAAIRQGEYIILSPRNIDEQL